MAYKQPLAMNSAGEVVAKTTADLVLHFSKIASLYSLKVA